MTNPPPSLPAFATALACITDTLEDHSVSYPGLDILPMRMKAIRVLNAKGFKNPTKQQVDAMTNQLLKDASQSRRAV